MVAIIFYYGKIEIKITCKLKKYLKKREILVFFAIIDEYRMTK